MTQWPILLERLLAGLRVLEGRGFVLGDWTLGGGTALMIAAEHRLSRDIDVFIDSPEYLTYLSPRLGGETVWNCAAYDESANFLKLRFSEGEIDFIAAVAVSQLPAKRITLDLSREGGSPSTEILVEHPVEIALKKLFYRGSYLLIRDAFDICVVDQIFPETLRSHLHLVSHRKPAIEAAIRRFAPDFVRQSLQELDILPDWEDLSRTTHERIISIASCIPDASPEPSIT
ncbi:nucleotidyl transferase AbiEii/AbiGii toxin family protein [Salinarimonas ramus]|uniref:Nucleotidyl transferase AbiEii toxin, Type IV TA system n=1 Tax=Salinarimonas ramus TaxID=690164 RepID=A0A917V2V2_9HYPH|nr:nucleotidyl transferase AbiEii/AbiGii toxin family protein [Salinarimonas ramus]GGK31619.1 hypothetical protein GCM10011322_17720 [Salinarimonas ramus]